MPMVREILARKGPEAIGVAPATTVLEAARLMNDRGIGSVLVKEGDRLIGIFTERDVLRRVVADQRDPATTPVRDVMTASLVTCTPDTPIEECTAILTSRRIRHLPVVDAAGIRGVISSRDLLGFKMAEQEATIEHLNRYVFDVR